MPAQDRILQYLMQNLAQGGETTPQTIREYPTARVIPGASRSDIAEYPTGPVLPPDSRAKIIQMLGNNVAPTGSSNPGVARALQGGVGNPAGAVPSPTFEFADQYAKQQMPPITPNYQAYQYPRDRYSDVVNAVRQHAMQLGGAGGNAGNRMGFVEGETGKNALRGLAAVGQTLAQAMLMKQMMDPGQQYYQPSSGRIINSNPNALDPADRMKLQMQEQQNAIENRRNDFNTMADMMLKLSALEANGEQGYESNARGNAVWDEAMRGRAGMGPAFYKDITAGQENESQTQYNYGKDAREDEMLPLEKAVKQSQEAQNLAGARSSNATAAKTEYGLERDRIDKPIETDTKIAERTIKQSDASAAPGINFNKGQEAESKAKIAKWKSDNPELATRGSGISIEEYAQRALIDAQKKPISDLQNSIILDETDLKKMDATGDDEVTFKTNSGAEVTRTREEVQASLDAARAVLASKSGGLSPTRQAGRAKPATPGSSSPDNWQDYQ